MPMTTAFAADLLDLILNAIPIANIADDAVSSPAVNLYVSLHTANPGASGSQNTSEATYTSYVRVAIARDAGSPDWTIASNVAHPAAQINFATATGGSETLTHWGLGLASSGAGTLLMSGPLTPTLAVSNGVPVFLTTATIITGLVS